MIYKWSKSVIRLLDQYKWNSVIKIYQKQWQPIFLNSDLFFEFRLPRRVWNRFIKFIAYI